MYFLIQRKNVGIGEEKINIRTLFVPELEKNGKITIQFACLLFNIYVATITKDFDDENLQVFRIDGNDRKLYRGEIPRNK